MNTAHEQVVRSTGPHSVWLEKRRGIFAFAFVGVSGPYSAYWLLCAANLQGSYSRSWNHPSALLFVHLNLVEAANSILWTMFHYVERSTGHNSSTLLKVRGLA